MAHSGFLIISVVAAVLAVLAQQSSALRCHYCSSDSSSGAYCNDPFDENTIPAESKRFSFVECVRPSDYIVQNGGRSVCQKIKDRVGDRVVTRRLCGVAYANQAKDACMKDQVSQSIQREFCEFCETEGCNGASQYGPAAVLVILSAAITKLLFL